jgi:protein-S-isoprenylcysteine O-methyltransferase Ste14
MLVGSFAGVTLAFVTAGLGAHLPGPRSLPPALGLAVMWAGAIFRYWSVRTLGQFFTVTVQATDEHRLVDTGPYAVLRHPSYTGILVVYLGLGIALDSWFSVACAVLLPAAAVLNRIKHEEAALRQQLGQQYERYAANTRRLVPGVW